MRLRLYHHTDGARIAYREAGTGPPLALLHSALLSHREWEPLVGELSDRFRLILPDLPLHGHSEDRPWYSYEPDWFEDVLAGFLHETCGARPLVAGHEIGAQLLLRTVVAGKVRPSRMVLMPNAMHARTKRHGRERLVARLMRSGAVPGLGWGMSHLARGTARPAIGERLTYTGNAAARDLVRHAFADIGGNTPRMRAWAAAARRWPSQPFGSLLDFYGEIDMPVLLLWADKDEFHPESIAEEALDLLPDGQLRVLGSTGFLIAYDDPVGVAREIAAFCL